MKKQGVITRVIDNRGFFFIDNDYFCHFDSIDFQPVEGDRVNYEGHTKKDGKKEARNVIKIEGFVEQYITELEKGYFIDKDFIKKEYLLDYAKELAEEFTKNSNINKPTQIRKFFDFCYKIYGLYKVNRNYQFVQSELPKIISYLNSALKKGLISQDFYKFMEKNIEMALKDEKNFAKGFIPHFEAVIGFSQK